MNSDDEFVKITIRIRPHQREKLRKLYPNIGYNGIIRTIIDQHIKIKEEEEKAGKFPTI